MGLISGPLLTLILQEKGISGVQPKNEILVNMDIAESWTPKHALSSEKSDAKGDQEKSSGDLHLEGSPQMPDLLPATSPQVAQEGSGSLPSKHKSEISTPSPTPAIEDRLEIDGVLNQCARLLIDSPREHGVQSEMSKDHGEKASPSPTGTPARNSELF